MGRPIVYCDGCGKRLGEDDFARGKAHEVDHRNFCVECRPAPAPPPVPPAAQKRLSSRSHLAAPRPSSKSNPAIPPAPPPTSNKGLWIGLGAGALVILAIVGAVASSGGGSRPSGEEIRLPRHAIRTAAPPPPVAGEDGSREPLLRALAFKRANPNDLGGQIREFEAALGALAGTRHEEDAKRELAAAGRRMEKELEELDPLTAPLVSREEFGPALSLLEAARRRYDFPGWVLALDAKIGRLRQELERAKAEVRAQADDAKKRKSADELSRLAGRVERWGLRAEGEALSAHFVLERPPAPPPPAPPPPPEPRNRLAPALPHLAARDFDAALAALGADAKEEAELVRLAKTAFTEGLAALLRAPRGKPLALEYRDPWGAWTKVDDVLLRGDAARLEIKLGQDSLLVPVGEISLRTLAEAYMARPGAKGDDAPAAAALRRLDADAEPDLEARRIFFDAEFDIHVPERAAEALAAYRSLMDAHASTSFVRRNRAAIQGRLDVPKERIFLPDEMKAAGTFKRVPNRKVERAWTSEKDSDDRKANFIEVAVDVRLEKPPKVFALLGGCCAETFAAHVRIGEGDVDVPLKHTITGLKRRHEDHVGPKEPDRWEWVSIPLPKFAEGGTKTLRILTEQKGFSVATIVATTERTSPSKEWELKDVERRRADVPGYLAKGGARLGQLTLEIYNGGGGGLEDLKKIPGFPERPAARRPLRDFESARNVGEDYGSRVRGFVHPPLTGDYVFWITSDDQGELWLAADDDPKTKALIAGVPEWTAWDVWDKFPSQGSKPVRLEAGRRYYVELLQKEGWGEDHFRVRWRLPDGRVEEPIPGPRLSAWTRP